ncbi:trypsin-like serine protease [Corynebacterium suedekumii]|nr:trypsin-like serine protease [Corynebacterium suedekumii]
MAGWSATPSRVLPNLATVVRSGALIYNNPPAVRGDSGGPVIVDGEVVGVQSLITDPFGKNLRIATIQQVAPYHRQITSAVDALRDRY